MKKLLEKLVYNRITKFLITILSTHFSLVFDIITLPTEDIRENLDEGKAGCGIFVDLQEAFDTVNHHILDHDPCYLHFTS